MIAECNVCGKKYEDWSGQPRVADSLAFIVEDGEKTTKTGLFASVNDGERKPTIIDFGKGETNE